MRKKTVAGKCHGPYFDEIRISPDKPYGAWPVKYDRVFMSNFDPRIEIAKLKKQIEKLKARPK